MLNKHLFSEHINSEGWLFTSTYLPRLLYAVEFIPFQGFQTLKKKAREILPVPSFSCKALDRVIYIGDLPYSLVSETCRCTVPLSILRDSAVALWSFFKE